MKTYFVYPQGQVQGFVIKADLVDCDISLDHLQFLQGEIIVAQFKWSNIAGYQEIEESKLMRTPFKG
jgi:hypothetical protein